MNVDLGQTLPLNKNCNKINIYVYQLCVHYIGVHVFESVVARDYRHLPGIPTHWDTGAFPSPTTSLPRPTADQRPSYDVHTDAQADL